MQRGSRTEGNCVHRTVPDLKHRTGSSNIDVARSKRREAPGNKRAVVDGGATSVAIRSRECLRGGTALNEDEIRSGPTAIVQGAREITVRRTRNGHGVCEVVGRKPRSRAAAVQCTELHI